MPVASAGPPAAADPDRPAAPAPQAHPRASRVRLPALLVFALAAAFFAWVSATPLWLTPATASGGGDGREVFGARHRPQLRRVRRGRPEFQRRGHAARAGDRPRERRHRSSTRRWSSTRLQPAYAGDSTEPLPALDPRSRAARAVRPRHRLGDRCAPAAGRRTRAAQRCSAASAARSCCSPACWPTPGRSARPRSTVTRADTDHEVVDVAAADRVRLRRPRRSRPCGSVPAASRSATAASRSSSVGRPAIGRRPPTTSVISPRGSPSAAHVASSARAPRRTSS